MTHVESLGQTLLFTLLDFVCSLKIAGTLLILRIITKRMGSEASHTGTVSIF